MKHAQASLLLCGLLLCAHAQQSLQQNVMTCPIAAEDTDLDFTKTAAACSDAKTVCSACTCALVEVFTPALRAGGVAFDPQDPAALPLERAAGIIRACSEQFVVSMMMANINMTALAGLSRCTYTADNAPKCLAPAVAAIAAGNTTVKATSRDEAAAVPAATTALRVATVQKAGTGVTITLAGQLSSAVQLLQTLAASSDLIATLPSETAQKLQTLAAAPAAIDANPAAAGTLAALSNPIDAVALVDNLSKLAGSAAAPAAPAPAPVAPAPTSGAVGLAAARPVLGALASILLVAALL